MSNLTKYINVRDDILYQIRSGLLQPGEKLYSRREICQKYGISDVTAHKVQSELQKQGLVHKVAGRGFFINTLSSLKPFEGRYPKLRQVRIIGAEFAIGEDTIYGHRLIIGIEKRCRELGLKFKIDYIDTTMQNTGVLNSKYQIEPDEGLLVFMHSGLLAEVFLLLLSPDIRSVVINRIFPDKASVMVDNRQGMYEIFNHLVDRKCRKVIFAGRFPESQSQVNESEHFNNFLHEVNVRNIEHSTVVSGNFNELLTITEQENPDAIIFSGDDAALLFKKLAQDRLKSIPYLVGFGDIAVREAGIESLTTYHIDCEAMGMAAVEQLLEHKDSFSKPLNRRVPGKLIIRE